MPVYRYECGKCGLQFDKLISQPGSSPTTGCINCGSVASKQVSSANHNFNSTRKQGETGVHDIDYPVLDKAVGRSSESRWKEFGRRHETELQACKEYGTPYLGKVPVESDTDEYYKVSDTKVEYRRQVAKEFDEILSNQG